MSAGDDDGSEDDDDDDDDDDECSVRVGVLKGVAKEPPVKLVHELLMNASIQALCASELGPLAINVGISRSILRTSSRRRLTDAVSRVTDSPLDDIPGGGIAAADTNVDDGFDVK